MHVVNKLITDCFQKYLDCIDRFTVILDNDLLSIKIYDEIVIITKTSKRKEIIIFTKICYRLDFIVNVVADSILADKNFYFYFDI